MIRLVQLTKRYGKFTAVDGIDLVVPSGELFGFLGPNGAGKTTTFRMIAGILQPTSGTVEIGGIDVIRRPLEAKKRQPRSTARSSSSLTMPRLTTTSGTRSTRWATWRAPERPWNEPFR